MYSLGVIITSGVALQFRDKELQPAVHRDGSPCIKVAKENDGKPRELPSPHGTFALPG